MVTAAARLIFEELLLGDLLDDLASAEFEPEADFMSNALREKTPPRNSTGSKK